MTDTNFRALAWRRPRRPRRPPPLGTQTNLSMKKPPTLERVGGSIFQRLGGGSLRWMALDTLCKQ